MSSIPHLSTGPSSALFPSAVHAHGHKRGAPVDAGGDSTSEAAQHSGAVENTDDDLLQSLEQVVGLQPGATPSGTAAQPPSPMRPCYEALPPPPPQLHQLRVLVRVPFTANATVQNYLNNLSLKQSATAQMARPLGSTLIAHDELMRVGAQLTFWVPARLESAGQRPCEHHQGFSGSLCFAWRLVHCFSIDPPAAYPHMWEGLAAYCRHQRAGWEWAQGGAVISGHWENPLPSTSQLH